MPKGTSVSRILLGSAATWVRIGVTVCTQLALLPLYLGAWDAPIYGAWLLLLSVWAVVSVVDLAHHDYVGYECLRLGGMQRSAISRVISSAIPIAMLIGLWDLVLVWQLGQSSYIADWIGGSEQLLNQWRSALILQAITWLLTGCLGGLIVRWLTPFGYWPQFAWWGVLQALMTSIAPAFAVLAGADILQAMLALCLTSVVYHLIFFLSMVRVIRQQGFNLTRPTVAQGIRQFVKALWLVGKSLAEIARQQGVRIILTPLAGVSDMAAFSTMRTGTNFALQGLNTITWPIMPELMRFLAERDQARTESAFSTVWLVLCAVLCPAILLAQWLAPELFPVWTRGKIAFDPWLFGVLSLGVTVLALAQPAAAVLMGNNIVRAQFAIALLAAIVAVVGMTVLVPLMGVRGASVALLAAELTSLVAFVWVAQRWLRQQGMYWPWKAFGTVAMALPSTALGMLALELLPSGLKLGGLVLAFILQGLVAIAFWRQLPALARRRGANLMASLLPACLHRMIPALEPQPEGRTTTKV